MRWALLVAVCSACTVGPPDGGTNTSTNDEPDAAVSPQVDSAVAPPADAAGFACRDKQSLTSVVDGHHNPGQNCLNGCHNHGFTLAGTMFTSATSTTPFVGASITVTDANGKTFDLVTSANGNFFTKTTVAFPVTVIASACPSIHAMGGSIPAASAGCNKAGCHAATGGAGRITLP